MIYAGFWRRFGAYWLDFLVVLPVLAVQLWGVKHYRHYYLYGLAPGLLFTLYYHVYLVRRYGGTPGKLLLGILIRRVDGAVAGWREAVLRYLPNVLFYVPAAIAQIMVAEAMTDAQYFPAGFSPNNPHFAALIPYWYEPLNLVGGAWVWSEFIVMLTNHRRRALHDFLAGTVVLLLKSSPTSKEEAVAPSALTP